MTYVFVDQEALVSILPIRAPARVRCRYDCTDPVACPWPHRCCAHCTRAREDVGLPRHGDIERMLAEPYMRRHPL